MYITQSGYRWYILSTYAFIYLLTYMYYMQWDNLVIVSYYCTTGVAYVDCGRETVFQATGHIRICIKMKEEIWKTATCRR